MKGDHQGILVSVTSIKFVLTQLKLWVFLGECHAEQVLDCRLLSLLKVLP